MIIGSQVREVTGVVGDLRRDHDLLLVDDRLGVVALDVAAVAFHPLESGSVTLTSPCGISGGEYGFGAAPEPLRVMLAAAVPGTPHMPAFPRFSAARSSSSRPAASRKRCWRDRGTGPAFR